MPKNEKLVDFLVQKLKLSQAGAYRRISGKSILSFEEYVTLKSKDKKISIDELDSYIRFRRRNLSLGINDIEENLQAVLINLEHQVESAQSKVYYSTNEIPVFYNFAFPKLAAFKIYSWQNSITGIEKGKSKFWWQEYEERFSPLWEKLVNAYSKIPTIELWSENAVLNFIRQLNYYYSAKLIAKKEAIDICEQYVALFKVIKKQAVQGQKLHPNFPYTNTNLEYELYSSELLVLENSVLAIQDNKSIFFQGFAYFNFLPTTDAKFCSDMEFWFKTQMRDSIKLSKSREKERNEYFDKIETEIYKLMDVTATSK